MDSYVGYRSELLGVRKHKYAFVGPTGRQLTGSDIADMFQRLTNVRLLCNVRRKATITWALAQPDMDRESLARLCRHTQSQQLRVINARMMSELGRHWKRLRVLLQLLERSVMMNQRLKQRLEILFDIKAVEKNALEKWLICR